LIVAILVTICIAVDVEIKNPTNDASLFASRSSAKSKKRSGSKFHKPRSQLQPGNFQVYQLAQSWTPEFCEESPSNGECTNLDGWATTHLAIHGLWPGYDDADAPAKHQWPEFCDFEGEVDPNDLPATLAQYGPGYIANNYKLANHEWDRHGKCTGFSTPNEYFQAAIDTLLNIPVTGGEDGTPQLIIQNVGGSVSQDDLRGKYPNKVALACTDQCSLKQVVTCWGVNAASPDVGSFIDCPDWTMSSPYDNSCYLNSCAQISIDSV